MSSKTNAMMPIDAFPGWLKWLLAALLAVWLPVEVYSYGAANLLWLCEVGNVLLVYAVWRESRLLLSALLAGLLLIDLAWVLDYIIALGFGWHPFGATKNMFNPDIPWVVRSASLFHAFVPVVLLRGVYRLGYDRHGFALQTAITAVALPVSLLWCPPVQNVNWVWGLGAAPHQEAVHPLVYLLFCMFAYPLVLYLPVHVLALRWLKGGGSLTVAERDC